MDILSAGVVAVLPRFQLGQLTATPNALEHVPNSEMFSALTRHASCDWGDLDAHDRNANEQALMVGGRLFSQYLTKQGIKFWIITECDRSLTTVLLPEDY